MFFKTIQLCLNRAIVKNLGAEQEMLIFPEYLISSRFFLGHVCLYLYVLNLFLLRGSCVLYSIHHKSICLKGKWRDILVFQIYFLERLKISINQALGSCTYFLIYRSE